MKFWWITDSARLGAEKAAVEQLAADEGWFKLTQWRLNAFRLSADGIITAAGIEYPVRLIYPDQFPSVPAWVEPQDGNVRWSSHQYGVGGALCLELRPDNWVPTATGGDVLRSAFHLLQTENPLGDGDHGRVASAHNIGEVQSYDWGLNPVLVGAGCLERLRAGSSADVRAIRWSASDDVWRLMVFDAIDSAQPQHPPSFDLGTLRHEVPVLVARADVPEPTPTTRADLAAALSASLDPERHKDAIVLIAVAKDRITAFHSPDPNSVFERKWVVLPDQRGVRSGRRAAAAGKRVAVVGLGSIGSKLAEMLLRSGIHTLLLVDGDVMLPVNLERHTLDWRDVGYRKVNGLKRRLLQIVPGASVDVLPTNLNWQRSAKSYASDMDQLARCDLIIDATGDSPTTLLLGAIAADNAKSLVAVEVFEGGLGCVIARSVPGRDPAYVHGRSAYLQYCERRNIAPPQSGSRPYETLGNDGDPIIADDAAVSIAASHAARVALDVLDDQVAPADAAWLLMGFKTGWLFSRHGETISLDLGPPIPPPTREEDPAAREFASSLLIEAVGESKTTE